MVSNDCEHKKKIYVNREKPQRYTKKVKSLTKKKNKNKGVAKNKTIYNTKTNCQKQCYPNTTTMRGLKW